MNINPDHDPDCTICMDGDRIPLEDCWECEQRHCPVCQPCQFPDEDLPLFAGLREGAK